MNEKRKLINVILLKQITLQKCILKCMVKLVSTSNILLTLQLIFL